MLASEKCPAAVPDYVRNASAETVESRHDATCGNFFSSIPLFNNVVIEAGNSTPGCNPDHKFYLLLLPHSRYRKADSREHCGSSACHLVSAPGISGRTEHYVYMLRKIII